MARLKRNNSLASLAIDKEGYLEEGSFTWTSNASSPQTGNGFYRKVGKMVWINIVLFNETHTFSALSGLPFTTDGSYPHLGYGRALQCSINSGGRDNRIYVEGSGITIRNTPDGTGGDGAQNMVSGTSVAVRCAMSGWYPITSEAHV